MSTRLQVVMDDAELREIRQAARRHRMTVAEWVRQALRTARRRQDVAPADRKLQAVREATRHQYPAADIGEMLSEIERGYGDPSR